MIYYKQGKEIVMKNKLNKKLEIVPGEIKEYEGNTFIGFLACLTILLILLGLLYYLETKGITNITNLI